MRKERRFVARGAQCWRGCIAPFMRSEARDMSAQRKVASEVYASKRKATRRERFLP